MNCKKAEKLLVEYLYQELSPSQTVAIEKHLQSCENCAKTLESWRAIHGGFQNSDYPEVSPYLKQKILTAARQELTRKPTFMERFSFLLKPSFVLPVMIFGLLALFYIPFRANRNTEIVMASKPQPSPAVSQMTEAQPNKQEVDRLESRTNSERSDGGYREKTKEEALTKSKDSKLRDSSVAQRQPEDYEKAAAAKEAGSLNGFNQASQENENKKSMTAASPPAEIAQASPAPPPASEPPQAEGGQKYDEKNAVGGMLAYKSQSIENNAVTFQRAQMQIKNNELSKGRETAQQAIDQDKGGSLASQFHQAGVQYQKEHENDKAILQFNLLMKNYPDYPQRADVLLRLGDSYRELGRYDEAQKTYEQLLALQPSNKTAAQRLMLLNKRKQSEEQLRSLGYVEPN